MKKTLLIILAACGLTVFGYSRILQSQANHMQSLLDSQCTQVHPSLIAYKKAFNNKNYTEYIDNLRKYIPLQEQQLSNQNNYVHSWSFQLFQPSYMKELAVAQIELFQAYHDHAKSILNLFDQPPTDKKSFEESISAGLPIAQKVQEAQIRFENAQTQVNQNADWRSKLWTNPVSHCPPELQEIPDTSI